MGQKRWVSADSAAGFSTGALLVGYEIWLMFQTWAGWMPRFGAGCWRTAAGMWNSWSRRASSSGERLLRRAGRAVVAVGGLAHP